MYNACKKIAAFTLSLALAASNAGISLQNNNGLMSGKLLTANAMDEEEWSRLPGDESYFDAETKTLHLKGTVSYNVRFSGIVTPEGVNWNDIETIIADEGTILPGNCSNFFYYMPNLRLIDLRNADTSNVWNMDNMFSRQEAPEDPDAEYLLLGDFDTSNVTNMSGMFINCKVPDISSFDTSNVKDMSYMFMNAYSDDLDLSNFDTSNVRNMSGMFEDSRINSVNINSFDTGNVTNMSYMFRGCDLLNEIQVSSFDTHKVTDMSEMFSGSGCSELDLSRFYISDDTTIKGMFTDCAALTFLKLPYGWTKEKLLEKDENIFADSNKNLVIKGEGYETYYDVKTQTLHLKGNVLTNSNGNGILLPNRVQKEDVKVVTADEGTVLPNNCSHFFDGFTDLRAVHLKNADTSSVTDMSYMFDNATRYNSKLEYIDLTNCDTSNVTTMEGMFMNCQYAIFKLDGIDTSNVTNMSKMFAECGWYEYVAERIYCPSDDSYESYEKVLDLSVFDTSSVTNMSGMFDGAGYRSIDLSSFDTSKATDMSDMFKGCIMLKSLDLHSFDTSNVTDMSGMFQDTYSDLGFLGYYNDDLHGLEEIDLSNFDTSSVTNMSSMFATSGFKELDLSSFETEKVTDMSDMFAFSGYLNSLNIKSFDTRNVKDMSGMFAWVFMHEFDIHHFTISDDTNISGMFSLGSKYSTNRDITIPYDWTEEKMLEKDCTVFWSYETPNVIEATDESYYDTKTKTLHLKGYVRNAKYPDGIVLPDGVDKDEIEAIVVEEGAVLPQNCVGLFAYMDKLESVDLKNADTSFVLDMSAMFEECWNLTLIDLSNIDTSNVRNMAAMFAFSVNIKTLDLSSFDTSKVKSFRGMFRQLDYSSLETLDISSFDTSKATNMEYMFNGCCNLETLDVSHFDTSNVTSMEGMFAGCELLESIDVSNFDTSNVYDMGSVFAGCRSLKELDLSSFDIHHVTYTQGMFANCTSLKTIYVNADWEPSGVYSYQQLFFPPWVHNVGLEDATDMFTDCTELVGGAGTVYDSYYTGIEYARIDGGEADPGYLTLKDDKNDFIKTHNLVLSGQIGVSFNLDLSSLSDKEKAASYMEFTLNGKTSTAKFNKNSKSPSGKYYSFTYYVTSVEMADTITAVFHFGNGKTISETYSVLDYINKLEQNSGCYDKTTLDLIHAIADYGHYAQPFLAASNNWTVGKEHKAMNKYYTSSYSYEDVSKAASKYERVLALGKSDIEKITYSLSLNADTTVNVFIKPRSSYSGSIKVTTQKGNAATSYTAVKQADGRYKVTIPNISAHHLGDTYTITVVTANGTASCKVSALSYVNAILNENSSTIAKNAVSAFYRYYEAIMIYRENS